MPERQEQKEIGVQLCSLQLCILLAVRPALHVINQSMPSPAPGLSGWRNQSTRPKKQMQCSTFVLHANCMSSEVTSRSQQFLSLTQHTHSTLTLYLCTQTSKKKQERNHSPTILGPKNPTYHARHSRRRRHQPHPIPLPSPENKHFGAVRL